MQKYGLSQGEIFYNGTHIGANFKYSVFSSAKMIARINDLTVRNFNIDATFKVVPNGELKQFLMIHIVHEEHAFPIIYVLMSRKTEEAYTHLFRYNEENVCHLRPTSCMTDFEFAMRNAIRTVYPNCTVYACWFHF